MRFCEGATKSEARSQQRKEGAHLGKVQSKHRAISVPAASHVPLHLRSSGIARDEHFAIAACENPDQSNPTGTQKEANREQPSLAKEQRSTRTSSEGKA